METSLATVIIIGKDVNTPSPLRLAAGNSPASRSPEREEKAAGTSNTFFPGCRTEL
jgi:hypothetical protein